MKLSDLFESQLNAHAMERGGWQPFNVRLQKFGGIPDPQTGNAREAPTMPTTMMVSPKDKTVIFPDSGDRGVLGSSGATLVVRKADVTYIVHAEFADEQKLGRHLRSIH